MPNKSNVDGSSSPIATQQNPPAPPSSDYSGKGDKGPKGEPRANVTEGFTRHPKHWTIYVETFCTIALVFITGFYTYYAHQQAKSAITAANAAQSAAETAVKTLQETQRSNARQAILAQNSLNASSYQFRQDQRPYIGEARKSTEGPKFFEKSENSWQGPNTVELAHDRLWENPGKQYFLHSGDKAWRHPVCA